MELRRPRYGDALMGAGGLALLVALFLPWYEASDFGARLSGWESFLVTDVLMLLAGLMALSAFALAAGQRSPALAIATTALTALFASIVAVLVLWRVLDPPQVDALDGAIRVEPARLAGAYVGLGAVLAAALGAWLAMRDWRPRVPARRPPVELEEPQVELVAAPAGNGSSPREP